MAPPEGIVLAKIRQLRQYVGPDTLRGLGLGAIDRILTAIMNIPSNVRSAGSDQIVDFLTAFILGVLGIVPGVLSMCGYNKAASIISVVAGAIACTVSLGVLCSKYRIQGTPM